MKSLILVCVLGIVHCYEDKNVVQYLSDNGYNTLVSLMKSHGLTPTLTGSGPFTVFAPTDAAFQKLGQSTLDSLSPVQITDILKYHVVSEFILLPMIRQQTQKATLLGTAISLIPSNGSIIINNHSRINPTNNDIIVNNGVIQPIDTVMLPPQAASENLAQTLLRDHRFNDLFLSLVLANLVSTLEFGDYTLFAPVDTAFVPFKDNLMSPTAPNAQALYQAVLKYHIVPGARRVNMLRNGQSLYTLEHTSVNVTVHGTDVRINTAHILEADIIATNGVIHAIDHLLIPSDLGHIAQG